MANISYPRFGKRHVIVLWLFTGFINLYILRVCINVAIVSMVKYDNSTGYAPFDPNRTDICPVIPNPPENGTESNNKTTKKEVGEFAWDHATRGVVLSAFYYGFICTQFFGGYLPQIIGGRIVFGLSVGLTGILTVLNPTAARISPAFHIAVRALEGALEGVHMPCSHYLLGNWAPRQERSTLVLFPGTGANIATIISAPITALLCEYGYDGGWPTAFYTWGALAVIWSAGWFYFVRDSPAQYQTISPQERIYIEENCEKQAKPVPFTKMPWKSILLSPPVWAIVAAQFGYSWNYNSALTGISTYLKDVLHISSALIGLLSMLPYAFLWLVQILAAISADCIRSKGVKTKWVRKGSYCLGMIISSIALACIGQAKCDTTIVVVLICISIGSSGLAYAGVIVNHIDIAPQYAGILMAIANTFACIPGIVSPTLTGTIVNKESTITTWQTVFYISAGISLGCAVIFALFGDGEVQKWAKIEDNSNKQPEDLEIEKSVKL